MYEVWLQSNRRALLVSLALPLIAELIGVGLLMTGLMLVPSDVLFWTGVGVMVVCQLLIVALIVQWGPPRIALLDNTLLLYLRFGRPITVPLEHVEGFLLGQGPTMLPGPGHDWETSTLVIKLADRAEEWRQLAVKPSIAAWCNSYVTIRGTWCEPLDVALVQRLNTRLGEVKPARKGPA